MLIVGVPIFVNDCLCNVHFQALIKFRLISGYSIVYNLIPSDMLYMY